MSLSGADLMTFPLSCVWMLPLGLFVLWMGVVWADPAVLARGLGALQPELAGILRYQVLLDELEGDPTTIRFDGTIVGVEFEEKDGVSGWVVLAEADDRLYVSEPLPADVSDMLVGEAVVVLVSAEDPERYIVDWFPVAERVQG